MSQQKAAAKKNDKKQKNKGKSTRVVDMASVPIVVSGDEELMAAVLRYETTQDTVEVTKATGSGDGSGNAKPDEKEEGEAPADKPAAADTPKE